MNSSDQPRNLSSSSAEASRSSGCQDSQCCTSVRGMAGNLTLQVHQPGRTGRPSAAVNIDQVEMLRLAGHSWQQVADCLGVSRATLWRRLHEQNRIIGQYTDISDHDLDTEVERYARRNRFIGCSIIRGYLTSIGIRVQRYRIRASLRRANPTYSQQRWHRTLRRRRYSVPGPNALWHIDGHHKLIRWRLVTHGGIDGFSRYIVFLHCSTNNRAQTVLMLFREAVQRSGLPSRVRSDRGGENVLVCAYMIATRGTGRGSHIAGASTHNQRIERLWRDVFRCVVSTYYELFYSMENFGILDSSNDVDVFVLHCVFLPHINQALQTFVHAWNSHPLRTEHNWSPYRIWLNGFLDPNRQEQTAISSPYEDYGVGCLEPLSDADEELDRVEIPETSVPLDEPALEHYLNAIGGLPGTIDAFILARDLLLQLIG